MGQTEVPKCILLRLVESEVQCAPQHQCGYECGGRPIDRALSLHAHLDRRAPGCVTGPRSFPNRTLWHVPTRWRGTDLRPMSFAVTRARAVRSIARQGCPVRAVGRLWSP